MNLLFSRLIFIFNNYSSEAFSFPFDVNFVFLCSLLRKFLNFPTWSFNQNSENVLLKHHLSTIGFKLLGQFSNQIFSKRHKKTTSYVDPKGEPNATSSHCS